MKKKIPYISAMVTFKSELDLDSLANIFSNCLFSGIPFGGRELNIYDEVPAVFIKDGILGLSIILSGFPGVKGDENYYGLNILPIIYLSDEYDSPEFNLDSYLRKLLESKLSEYITFED